MTVKNPYEPPTYGVVSKAIERRKAGKPPASLADEPEEKADPEPLNKMAAAPENKAAPKRKAK